ncbi:MAG TPA: hypothetical protein VGG48_17175 [Rhizomicrobium sp.]|jgi:predicted ArsR family transcriptional regulator
MLESHPSPRGRGAVLDILKREGPISADSIAEKLGLSGVAVRMHLTALMLGDLAKSTDEARPRGRPVGMWKLTPKADSLFTDSHSALATELVVQTRRVFGEEGLDRLLKAHTADQEKNYRAKTDSARSLRAKLEQLARIRSAEGYMAEVRLDTEGDGDFLFVENHCPICAAAQLCKGLCREELALFRRVLGKDVKIERVRYILAGDGRCAYRVTAMG